MIDAPNFGEQISSYVSMWRGFPRIAEQEVESDLELLFNQSTVLKNKIMANDLSKNEVQALPLGWQYLLPHNFYDG